MPKAHKHAEVKPSKFRTALCEFYLRQEECPYGPRCAFAHGEHELQTEQGNVELLRATGLQRLDGGLPLPLPLPLPTSTPTPSVSLPLSHPNSNPSRRRPVIVSIPCWTEAQLRGVDRRQPLAEEEEEEPHLLLQREEEEEEELHHPSVFNRRARCFSRISATCCPEAPLMYRHNPYNLSSQYH